MKGNAHSMLGLPDDIRACLFDLDGVLTDTASVHTKAWASMFDDYLRRRAHDTGTRIRALRPAADYQNYVETARSAATGCDHS